MRWSKVIDVKDIEVNRMEHVGRYWNCKNHYQPRRKDGNKNNEERKSNGINSKMTYIQSNARDIHKIHSRKQSNNQQRWTWQVDYFMVRTWFLHRKSKSYNAELNLADCTNNWQQQITCVPHTTPPAGSVIEHWTVEKTVPATDEAIALDTRREVSPSQDCRSTNTWRDRAVQWCNRKSACKIRGL